MPNSTTSWTSFPTLSSFVSESKFLKTSDLPQSKSLSSVYCTIWDSFDPTDPTGLPSGKHTKKNYVSLVYSGFTHEKYSKTIENNP